MTQAGAENLGTAVLLTAAITLLLTGHWLLVLALGGGIVLWASDRARAALASLVSHLWHDRTRL